MGYTIQIASRGKELLSSEDVKVQIDESVQNHQVISDLCARTIASWWHSSGPDGQHFSRLSHGLEFDTEDLLSNIASALVTATEPGAQLELWALTSWAEHWTGDHRS
jgi:hypothetical protein